MNPPALTLVRRADAAVSPGVPPEAVVLAAGCVFEGRLELESGARIDGRFVGEIWTTAALRIGRGAHVIGQVRAASLVVEGTLEGEARVQGDATVTATASLSGRLVAAAWRVERGAVVQATLETPPPTTAGVSRETPR